MRQPDRRQAQQIGKDVVRRRTAEIRQDVGTPPVVHSIEAAARRTHGWSGSGHVACMTSSAAGAIVTT
jgi:hypothetical protein